MALIVDASAALPWYFVDEVTPETEALLNHLKLGATALVPSHKAVYCLTARHNPTEFSFLCLSKLLTGFPASAISHCRFAPATVRPHVAGQHYS